MHFSCRLNDAFFRLLRKEKKEGKKKKNVEDEDAWRIPTMFTLVIILCLFFCPPLLLAGPKDGDSTLLGIGCTKKEKEPLRYRFGHDMTWKRFMGLRFTSQVRQLQICVFFSFLRLVDLFLSIRNNSTSHIFLPCPRSVFV